MVISNAWPVLFITRSETSRPTSRSVLIDFISCQNLVASHENWQTARQKFANFDKLNSKERVTGQSNGN